LQQTLTKTAHLCRWRGLQSQKEGYFMKSFLVGLGIGIGLGVLFAPMSGEETRSNIRERATDLADNARETIEQGRERVRSGMSAIRGGVEQAVSEVQRPTGTEGAGL
jgi:gas vesicle protein